MVAQIDRGLVAAGPGKVWQRVIGWSLFEGRPLTTRGRWINPLVLGLHRVWHFLPIKAQSDRPIFIIGTGRSGTTLLARILGMHSQVGMLNEPKALWHAALGDDDLIGNYSSTIGRFRLGAVDAISPRVKRLARSYAAFCSLTGATRIVDKYPELVFRVGFLRQAFPDARILAILRDPWQTAASVAAWSARNGNGQADWWGKSDQKWRALVGQVILPDGFPALTVDELNDLDHANRAAVEWLAAEREIQYWRQQALGSVHLLTFEDLAREPARICRRILEVCHLPDDPRMVDYAKKSVTIPKLYPQPALHPTIEARLRERAGRIAA